MKLIVEDVKGYVDFYEDVFQIKIMKIDKKNILKVRYGDLSKNNELIPLREVKRAILIEEDSLVERFRYEK